MDQERVPPSVLFQSFMIVAGSYMASLVFLFILFGVVSRFYFPETFEFLSRRSVANNLNDIAKDHPERVVDPNLSQEQIQANAELIMPSNLFWILLVGQGLFSILVGWFATRIAPYAKFNHAIFVAVILFVSFLQMAVKNSGDLQWKLLVMMCVMPIAVLVGARIQGGHNPRINAQNDAANGGGQAH